MTEAEWLVFDDPVRLWETDIPVKHVRKARLLLIAHAYRMWEWLPEEARAHLRVAERFVEGDIADGERHDASYYAMCLADNIEIEERHRTSLILIGRNPANSENLGGHTEEEREALEDLKVVRQAAAIRRVSRAADANQELLLLFNDELLLPGENKLITDDIRCIFCNPFRHVSMNSDWLSSAAIELASHIYQQRAFNMMPVLADALQDAGCDNDDILAHCRGPGPHVRGCWVVDLILGKQ